MKKRNIFIALASSLTFLSCAAGPDSEWGSIEDHNKANISLNLEGIALNRSSARTIATNSSWAESGVWKNNGVNKEIQAWVYVYTIFDEVFTNRYPDKLEHTIREISGDGYLTLDEEGQLKTKFGPVNFQYYTVSGLNCFYVESYWSDQSLRGVDGISNGRFGEYIIGNNLMQAYYCESDRGRLQFEDVEEFLKGIYVRDVYWPEERFTDVDDLL